MFTLVKEQAARTTAEVKQAQLAGSGRPAATWAPAGQASPQESGLVGRFVILLTALDDLLAGPAMTEQERTQREVAQVVAENKHRLSLYY